jgi:hypothetical protein
LPTAEAVEELKQRPRDTNAILHVPYVVPLSPGQVLPASMALAKNFLSDEDLAKLPGVRTIPAGDIVPGPTADIYAFTRENVQRNLYRIPLP